MTTPTRTRVTRPDTSVEVETPSADPELIVDAVPGNPDLPKIEAVSISVPDATPAVNLKPPFRVTGTQVVDADGRTVCNVAQSHLTFEARTKLATFIAAKLNV